MASSTELAHPTSIHSLSEYYVRCLPSELEDVLAPTQGTGSTLVWLALGCGEWPGPVTQCSLCFASIVAFRYFVLFKLLVVVLHGEDPRLQCHKQCMRERCAMAQG